MPKKYNRSTEKNNWRAATMDKAIKAISDGMSIRKAARNFSIPESTIRKRLNAGPNYKARLGRAPIPENYGSFVI